MMRLLFLFILFPHLSHAKCEVYYFSLDFGGAINQGDAIVDYLGKEDVPFTLFLVGKNSSTANGKLVCEKIRQSSNKKISIGNHTISHEGFGTKHSEAHIRQEIIGNESYMNACDAKRVVKYFRYPKGSAHPLAEKVLKEAGYLGTYEDFFPQTDATKSKAVWWTTDTRDWVSPKGASAWAQIDFFNKKGKLLNVDKDSWRDLVSTLKSSKAGDAFNQKMKEYLQSYGEGYPSFESDEHVPGMHGPDADEIYRKVVSDEGKRGKDGKNHCFPLMHYGGINSFAAFKKIIPELKKRKVQFRGLGDGDTIQYQLASAVKTLDKLNQESEFDCNDPAQAFRYKVGEGESIFSIARTMINTNKTVCPASEKSPVSSLVASIIAINKINNTSEVLPGTSLVIPTNCLYVK